MSEEQTIEEMRYELGRESAQKGEPLHENPSEEFYHGYTDVNSNAWRGASNVMPRKFGKGRAKREPWICVCGYHNPAYIARVCYQCGVDKELAMKTRRESIEYQVGLDDGRAGLEFSPPDDDARAEEYEWGYAQGSQSFSGGEQES